MLVLFGRDMKTKKLPFIWMVGLLLALSATLAMGQDTTAAPQGTPITQLPDGTTVTVGTVASSSPTSLVVKTASGQYILFTYAAEVTKPATLATGATVRVYSVVGDDGLPTARQISLISATEAANLGATPRAQTGTPADTDPIPQSVRDLERDLSKQAKRYHAGLEAGFGLDPEIILVGVNARLGPVFSKSIFFRPSVDFAWGEVTRAFQLNLDGIVNVPVRGRGGRWGLYAGAGPNFSFVSENFERAQSGENTVDFSDFKFKAGLNIITGLQYRSGLFTEMRVGVYTTPTIRVVVGYQF